MVDTPKYPDIEVQLTNEDGNAMSIISRVMREMTRAGICGEERQFFFTQATSGNYDNVLQTCMEWVTVL